MGCDELMPIILVLSRVGTVSVTGGRDRVSHVTTIGLTGPV